MLNLQELPGASAPGTPLVAQSAPQPPFQFNYVCSPNILVAPTPLIYNDIKSTGGKAIV